MSSVLVYFKNPILVPPFSNYSSIYDQQTITNEELDARIKFINKKFPYIKYDIKNNKIYYAKDKICSNYNNDENNNFTIIKTHALMQIEKSINIVREKHDEIKKQNENIIFNINSPEIAAISIITQNLKYTSNEDEYWLRNYVLETEEFKTNTFDLGVLVNIQKMRNKNKPAERLSRSIL
jgi:hypothetical protein